MLDQDALTVVGELNLDPRARDAGVPFADESFQAPDLRKWALALKCQPSHSSWVRRRSRYLLGANELGVGHVVSCKFEFGSLAGLGGRRGSRFLQYCNGVYNVSCQQSDRNMIIVIYSNRRL